MRYHFMLLAAGAMVATGCSESTTEPIEETDVATLQVNASAGWAFVRLGESAVPVTVTDPSASTAWDIAFYGTSVMLNGGAAGPGGVEGYCLCQNEAVADAQLLELTATSEAADFEAVTAAVVPTSADAWQADVLSPAVTGWYAYNPVTHVVSADPFKVWKLRLAESANPGYAKFHVTKLEGAGRTNAGKVTVEYAVQTSSTATFGAVRTAVLDGSSGARVYFDFARGVTSDASDWDIALDGYTIRLNSGVSGSGRAGAVLASEEFAAMTSASDAPAQIYKADAFGGVFDEKRWYRYNLTGNHDITPTYDVYLVRRGEEVYKLQLTSYYNTAGESRRITFRYARVED